MAKKNTYNTNANSSLISGAGFAAKGYVSSSGSDAIMQAGSDTSYIDEISSRKQAADSTMSNFIESMPSNVDLDKVPEALRGETNKYLIDQRDFYFQNAKIAAREGASSPLYAEAVSNMNGVVMSFNKLNGDFDKLKEMKTNYISDYDKFMVSAGNRPEDIEFMTNLSTDKIPLTISASGRLNYGEGATLDDAPKYAVKDFETAKTLIELNKTIYSTGVPMDQGKEFIVRQQVRQALAKGGRDAVVSMATDDHIAEGGLGIQDQDLLTNPARTRELSKFVEDQYVSMLSQTAQSGYNAVTRKENRDDNRAVSRSVSLAKKQQAAGLSNSTTEETKAQTSLQRRTDDAVAFMNKVKGHGAGPKPLVEYEPGGKYDLSVLVGVKHDGAIIRNVRFSGPEDLDENNDPYPLYTALYEIDVAGGNRETLVLDRSENGVKRLAASWAKTTYGSNAATNYLLDDIYDYEFESQNKRPDLPILMGPLLPPNSKN